MANDWDLLAIVRSCSAAKSEGNDEVEKNLFNLGGILASGDYKYDDGNEVDEDPLDELQHIYRPFYGTAQPGGGSVTAESAGGGSEKKHQPAEYQSHEEKPEVPLQQRHRQEGVGSRRRIPSQAATRRRKCRPRLMIKMNGKTLSRDTWSWRKYGQKPIKGSPYPRNYYRCSTLKACCARKQVELSQENPEEYIVSYIGEHIHARPTTRRSTAGGARDHPPPCSAPPTAVTNLSSTTPLTVHCNSKTQKLDRDKDQMFEEEEEGGDFLIPNLQISEETIMAMHVLNSTASQTMATKPHYPIKDSSGRSE